MGFKMVFFKGIPDYLLRFSVAPLRLMHNQRVAVARALANGPALLIADEPTGNLDPKTSAHVFGFLERLVHDLGLAALFATHNLELAKKADTCLILQGGKIH